MRIRRGPRACCGSNLLGCKVLGWLPHAELKLLRHDLTADAPDTALLSQLKMPTSVSCKKSNDYLPNLVAPSRTLIFSSTSSALATRKRR